MPAKKSKKYKFGKPNSGTRKFEYATVDAPIGFGESVFTEEVYGKVKSQAKEKMKKVKKKDK